MSIWRWNIIVIGMISELNERSREIFRFIVDSYLDTGQPVGSRTISQVPHFALSAASIRNIMADLEDAGLLYAPHISAGRVPTEQGLRFYVDGLMQIGNLSAEERKNIESAAQLKGRSPKDIYEHASLLLSQLSSCASLVLAPSIDSSVRQIQFVQLEPGRVLVVLVMSNGLVENRILEAPVDLPPTALLGAANYLNSRLEGKTIETAQKNIAQEIRENRTQLDALTTRLVEQGLAMAPITSGHIIVRGQSKLLDDVKAVSDLERVRTILARLEEQETMLKLLNSVNTAQGVQIFIGAENDKFSQSGCSLIISPYKNASDKIIGAIGVIGPTRIDYGRIIPMVDYTSRVVERLMDDDWRG